MEVIPLAGREVFWNISAWGNLVYPLMAIALLLFVWAIYRRSLLWRRGKAVGRNKDDGWQVSIRIRKMLADVLAHRRILREPIAGTLHLILFWAFLSFFALTSADFIHHYFFPFLKGRIYLWFSLIVDLFGILALFAIVGFAFQRHVLKLSRLDNRPGDMVALLILFFLILSGFFVEGHRLAATEMRETPAYALWSVGGWIYGRFFLNWGAEANKTLHRLWWFLHLFLVAGAGIYVALSFSKLMHAIVAPINIFFRSLRPRGELLPIDFETAGDYGVSRINDFTWKQLLALDACTRCGRCQENCPAHLSGKLLSPQKIIQDLKGEMEKGWSLFSNTNHNHLKPEEGDATESLLIGESIQSESLWDCTSCGACVEACPVCVEHVDKMIDMRRGQVLNERGMPQTVQETLRSMEIRGYPWRGAEYLRDDWAKEFAIKTLAMDSQGDWLLWVGCTGALVDRNMEVTKKFAGILIKAGVNFRILGNEETCCGDPARRMGHELQFQMMAQQNIEIMKGYGVKRIVTPCPHCYNTLKNEYPKFGGKFEVWHHSELLKHLINEKQLSMNMAEKKQITYHDPCYLGRYNNIFDAPRELLQSIPGLELVEMKHCREKSFCCGGGGGHAWMEEPVGRRINQMRMEQAAQTGAAVICVACPFCLQMMEDAAKNLESSVKAMDICELL